MSIICGQKIFADCLAFKWSFYRDQTSFITVIKDPTGDYSQYFGDQIAIVGRLSFFIIFQIYTIFDIILSLSAKKLMR